MADKVYYLNQEEDRFRFEVESKILNRTVEAIEVRNNAVGLLLSGGSFMIFRVDGNDIVVTVPDTPCPMLDTTERVQ